MGTMTERLLSAMNAHDLDEFVALFASDYSSLQPAHPDRAFSGNDQVRQNWSAVFAGVPDFHAELLVAAALDAGIEVAEWRWSGTHTDGAPFEMRGMTVLGIDNGRIAWGRLYMEPVDHGGDIDEMVRDTYQPPPTQ